LHWGGHVKAVRVSVHHYHLLPLIFLLHNKGRVHEAL
jgi:hypothetical protein